MAPVFLNHFFLTLDRATFAAIRGADWLKTVFAPFEERTTRRNDVTYSGIYFYGRNTYFEFFEEGSEIGKVIGATGVAFGMEVAGGAKQLAHLLPDQTVITRRTEAGEPAWFHSASPAGAGRAQFFRTWVMEYHADFLKDWYGTLPPLNANLLRRRNVLDRYVAKIGLWDKRNEFLLKDVTAIELALGSALRKQLLDLLQGFGYQMTGSGAMVVATGPENRLMVPRRTWGHWEFAGSRFRYSGAWRERCGSRLGGRVCW